MVSLSAVSIFSHSNYFYQLHHTSLRSLLKAVQSRSSYCDLTVENTSADATLELFLIAEYFRELKSDKYKGKDR